MKVTIGENRAMVQGMSDADKILFFAKISEQHGYCVVFGPPEKCLPKEDSNMSELFDAKVAFGELDAEMKVVEVKHGHKYVQGGGFVETKQDGQIFFRLPGNKDSSTYEGMRIEEVYDVI